jgi:hypothetical protein
MSVNIEEKKIVMELPEEEGRRPVGAAASGLKNTDIDYIYHRYNSLLLLMEKDFARYPGNNPIEIETNLRIQK